MPPKTERRSCGCGYPLLTAASKGRGQCERCHLEAGGESTAKTMTDVLDRRAQRDNNKSGRA